jgi:TrmH family RNA methyltransferase
MDLGTPITSRTNARVKALRASFSGHASAPGELLGIEGEHLLAEALRSHLALDTVFVRQGSEDHLQSLSLSGLRPASFVMLSREVFDSAVDTTSPQGIAATLAIPEIAFPGTGHRPGIVLVVESLQDPGNLGTLLRSAEAFGVDRIFLTPETVNPWNPKVVRASAGSVFRTSIARKPLPQIAEQLRAAGVKLCAAVAQSANATPVMHADLTMPCALMVGNEGAGLSQAALRLADERINIPCAAESLNAAIAASTLMYEAMRQNLKNGNGEANGSGKP